MSYLGPTLPYAAPWIDSLLISEWRPIFGAALVQIAAAAFHFPLHRHGEENLRCDVEFSAEESLGRYAEDGEIPPVKTSGFVRPLRRRRQSAFAKIRS
jgi:hypothetical protein